MYDLSNKNILFIAPYKELADEATKVINDMEVNIEVIHSISMKHSMEYVSDYLSKKNIDAVITRGGTALKLKREFDFPVIEIEVSVLDILRAVQNAKKNGDKIGIIGFSNVISNISSLSSLVGREIFEIKINSLYECLGAVKKASELGVDVIVGDRIAVETANRYGIRGELIASDTYECITKAIYKTIDIIEISQRQLAHSEELKIITQLIQSAIIAVDNKGIITLVNAEAERILNIKSDDSLKKTITKIIPEIEVDKVLKTGTNVFDEIIEVRGKNLVVHKIPIKIRNSIEGVVITFQKIDQIKKLEEKARNKMKDNGHVAKSTFETMIGESEEIMSIIKRAKKYSKVDSSILINGGTGTGKEVFAQSIHNHSLRKTGPFVAVNCAALPITLLESEFFGYVKGSFTGAKEEGKVGLFEQANGGTIFLDEIGEIPMSVQARLLRVLQEGEIQRLGDDKIITVDVRIICATNKDLPKLIEKNKFREDLYYRINVLNISLPDLNQRIEDIPLFVNEFVRLKSKKCNKVILEIEDELISRLCLIDYKGNIRQLENLVERLVIECSDGVLKSKNLDYVLDADLIDDRKILSIESLTKKNIQKALEATNNNKTKAAEILGIDRTTLWRKMREIGN